ncbi:ABC transporter permease [Ferrovibrio sp.]|uniref:ABC transporter permease n=1 Tax=Ferrovibrio sp. TaxID=1917215 RepID=UPI0035B170DC
MSLHRFILRRLLLILPLLFGIVLFTFILVRIGGEEPVALIAGPTATVEELALVRKQLGLDRSIPVQFGIYLSNVVQFDFGHSWISNKPVLSELLERVPATFELLMFGLGLGALIGIPAGLWSAFKPNQTLDQVTRSLSLLGFSIPTYWLAIMMLFVFFYLLDLAPAGMGRISLMVTPPPHVTGSYLIDSLLAGDMEALHSAAAQLVLPVTCVAIVAAAPIIKQTRAIAMDALQSDYVRFARASGLPPQDMRRIVLRNSLTPLITFTGTEITGLIGTTALIEYVFAWGGVGQYGLNAIIAGDFAVIQGYVMLLALFACLVFLVVDVVVALTEPRAMML